jgi:ABC-type transport system substrate-binding protein
MTKRTCVMLSRRLAVKALGAIPFITTALAQSPPNGGTKVLRYAFRIAETGFDPAQISDLYSQTVTAHIFDGLYRYDMLARPYKIEPNTADGMPDISEDFRTWTVRVKPGIYFDNDPAFKGVKRELVAADYVYAMKRFFDPRRKSPAFASLSELKILGIDALREAAVKGKQPFDYDVQVEGMRTLDRYTIQFKFAEPLPRFLQIITGGELFGAVAREVVQAYGDQIMAHPVGTSAFRLADWRRSSRIILEANPNYREHFYDANPNADDAEGQALLARFRGRKLPMIDRVEISIIEEQQPRWLSFLNKQQDLIERFPEEFVAIATPKGKLAPNLARQGIQLHRTLTSDVTVWVYNMDNSIVGGYDPARVALRRAISLSSNTQREIQLVRNGQAIPAQSSIMPNTAQYDASFVSENSEFSLPKAKALLDLYGYVDRDGDGWRERPDGSLLNLEVATQPDQTSRQLDELMRKDLAQVGIKVEFKTSKWAENSKNARAGKLMIWRYGNMAAAPDSGESLARGFTGHIGGQNLARFSNEKYDAIYKKIGGIPDGPERLALFEAAKKILAAYAPYKYGVHRILTDLAWPWLSGYRRVPYVSDWWQYVDIDAEQQARAIK